MEARAFPLRRLFSPDGSWLADGRSRSGSFALRAPALAAPGVGGSRDGPPAESPRQRARIEPRARSSSRPGAWRPRSDNRGITGLDRPVRRDRSNRCSATGLRLNAPRPSAGLTTRQPNVLVGSPSRHPIGPGSLPHAPIGIVGRCRSSSGWARVGAGISSIWLTAFVRVFPHNPHTMITDSTPRFCPSKALASEGA